MLGPVRTLSAVILTGMLLGRGAGLVVAEPAVPAPTRAARPQGGAAAVYAQAIGQKTPIQRPLAPRRAEPPVLSRAERTAEGYALIGSRFGTDLSKVQVFEGEAPVPASAIVSMADDRILVRSKVTGTVQHKVVVGGLSSQAITGNYPPVPAISGPAGIAPTPPTRAGSRPPAPATTLSAPPGAAPGAGPKHITTPALTLTGQRVNMTTGPLTLTGLRVEMTTGPLTLTGLRVDMATGPLVLTGLRVDMTTGPLAITGLRVDIVTGGLTLTGASAE